MEEKEEKEEKEVYRERPDLVAALEETYIRPYVDRDDWDGQESDAFAQIQSITEVVGETAVKLILKKVSFVRSQNHTVITSEAETPWWIFKKNAEDELTVETILANRIKVSREELVEFARKTLTQSLQVMEDMGITKAELLR
jgi:hypothetical protein